MHLWHHVKFIGGEGWLNDCDGISSIGSQMIKLCGLPIGTDHNKDGRISAAQNPR